MIRASTIAIGLLGIGLLIRAQLAPDNDSADASRQYTDHLRHMGEALILVDHGLAVYQRPYGELITPEHLDPIHTGLFPERTAPYPPLAMLAHWPLAVMDRAGILAPATAHRAVVWLWTLVALGACAVLVKLFAPLPFIAQAWAALLAVPLLVGIGINGFVDAGYLLFGALACLAWKKNQRDLATLWLALAAAMHFRAAVFVPLAVVALWPPRKSLVAAALVIPTLVAAAALTGTLDTIPAHNPVHYSHLKLPLALFALLTAGTFVFLWRSDERLVAATLVAAFALGIFERSHGWWHAGTLLAPGMVLAARPHRIGWQWPALAVWTMGSSILAYRHLGSVFWTWVPFAVGSP